MNRCRSLPLIWFALLALAGAPWAVAQYDEDEQTQDHAEQDRLYLERYAQPEEKEPEKPNAESLRQAYLARADELIRDRNHRAKTGQRYRVQTDDPRLDTRETLELLEGFRIWFDRFWSGRVEMAPYDRLSRVFLFYSFYKYNELLEGDFRYETYRPKGHYRLSTDVITLHSDPDSPGFLADALLHEAAHQLVEQRVLRAAGMTPRWLSEGLAGYFGYTYRDRDGEFQPGVVGGKSAALLGGEKVDAEGRVVLQNARRFLKGAGNEAGPVVDRVISIEDPERFYGEGVPLHYAVSWALVHYLLHGDGGAHNGAFAEFLGLVARGQGSPEALYRQMGLNAEELDAAVKRHLKGIKAK
jgi:hypothetical protein